MDEKEMKTQRLILVNRRVVEGREMKEVIIYGAEWCVYCHKARELAKTRGYTVIYKDIDVVSTKEEFKTKFPGVRQIPQIVVCGSHVGGFNEFRELEP